MIFPSELKVGDTVALVSPSSPTTPERVDLCKSFIEKLGYQVIVGESCKKRYHGYLAGTDRERAEDINRMFSNKQVKAILCIRGGYGSSRIMKYLDYDLIRKNPKIFVGYSDITNLNMAFFTCCNMVTFHGPMVSSNMLEHFDEYTRDSFFQTISMKQALELRNPVGREFKVLSHGKANGTIVGGNLALLINMIGTFYSPDFRGKILFIEDIYESVPRVNRMLDQLALLGVFDQVKGILIGDFSDCRNDEDENFLIDDLLFEYFGHLRIPVLSHIQCGHCHPTATIPLGIRCEIDSYQKRITFIKNNI